MEKFRGIIRKRNSLKPRWRRTRSSELKQSEGGEGPEGEDENTLNYTLSTAVDIGRWADVGRYGRI